MSSLLAEENQPQQVPAQTQQQIYPNTKVVPGQFQDKDTSIVFTEFKDKRFLAVTQLNKLGTVCQVSQECVKGEAGEKKCAVFNCDILLGQHQEEVTLLGRILGESLAVDKPLILTVAIKGLELSHIKKLADFVISSLGQ